jgi:phosphoglycolate phosphatase-like HAD superfamily hydrolase
MRKIFIWDLDDTLLDNVHDYANPLLDACRAIIRYLGSRAPHVTGIIELEQEIDKRRFED